MEQLTPSQYLQKLIDQSAVNKGLLSSKLWNDFLQTWNNDNRTNKVDLSEMNLSDLIFRNINLNSARLFEANLTNSSFSESILANALICLTNLSNAKFDNVNFRQAKILKSYLDRTIFYKSNLEGAFFLDSKGKYTSFHSCFLQNSTFVGATFHNSAFNGADLRGADLKYADLQNSKLECVSISPTLSCNGLNISNSMITLVSKKGGVAFAKYSTLNYLCDMFSLYIKPVYVHHICLFSRRFINLDHSSCIKLFNRFHSINSKKHKPGSFKDIIFHTRMRARHLRTTGAYGDHKFIQFLNDLNYLQERWEASSLFGKGFLLLWRFSCNYGRSFWQWAVWMFIIAFIFGWIYSGYPTSLSEFFSPDLNMVAFNISESIQRDASWFTPYYLSFLAFSTFGFGDIVPRNLAGEICLTIEVVLGYLMLGGLISIFSNIITRRSD